MLGSHTVDNTYNFQILFSMVQPYFTKKKNPPNVYYCIIIDIHLENRVIFKNQGIIMMKKKSGNWYMYVLQ